MKKLGTLLLVLSLAIPLSAQTLSDALPLLQKNKRTAAEEQQVLQLFRTATDPSTIFAAGASLVKIPPAKTQEASLINLIMRQNQPIKSIFAAIIVTAMGAHYEEFLPLLEQGLESQDLALRSYCAGAYGILNPENKTYTDDVVRLYIFDSQFALRVMNVLATTPAEQFKFFKKASVAKEPQTRAAAAMWLGNSHTTQANQHLLKMAKTEEDPAVQTQLAIALALNQAETLEQTAKGLSKKYASAPSTTYALALGFMTGNAIPTLRHSLVSKNKNERINTLRALAYMANILSNPDAFAYSNDRTFDVQLLKSFIPQLGVLSKSGTEIERTYADNALLQFEKLM